MAIEGSIRIEEDVRKPLSFKCSCGGELPGPPPTVGSQWRCGDKCRFIVTKSDLEVGATYGGWDHTWDLTTGELIDPVRLAEYRQDDEARQAWYSATPPCIHIRAATGGFGAPVLDADQPARWKPHVYSWLANWRKLPEPQRSRGARRQRESHDRRHRRIRGQLKLVDPRKGSLGGTS